MRNSLIFRAWFYFRNGWSTYFAFTLGAVNTLTLTYYLAVDNYDFLKNIFPTFHHYVAIWLIIVVPVLIIVGYVHFKKSPAYRSDASVGIEANPYSARMFANSDITVILNLKIVELLTHLSKNEKLSSKDIEQITEINNYIINHIKTRPLDPKIDLAFYNNFQKIYK